MSKPKSNIKTANLLTVSQMIDSTFGHAELNVINFKMLQTILVLLARQLRLLNRQVALESDSPILPTSDNNIVVSEIKIKSSSKKKAIEPKSSTLYYGRGTQSGKSSKEAMDTSIAGKREFEHLTTGWSSGATSLGYSDRISSTVQSETNFRDQKYYDLLERIEETRERVLRVINERKNSRDAGATLPSPMASMQSTEIEYEKLLVVERLAEKETRKHLPIVTYDVFEELMHKVKDIQDRLDGGKVGSAEFPKNIELMKELRKGASLTDAMAALQISTRLEAVEKAINIDTDNQTSSKSQQNVTKDEMQVALDTKQSEILARVNSMIKKMTTYLEESTKQAQILEIKLGNALNMKDKLQEMENNLSYYTHHLKVTDTELTSQMTNLQEQMTQVQLDLESRLEEMNETLANKGADTELLTDLNRVFQDLKIDIERNGAVQDMLNDNQKKLVFEIERLKYEIEILRDLKSDRDEALDSLRDKADIKDLNGMVTNECFYAYVGKFEKDINEAHLIFRRQEATWQKALDDLIQLVNDKVDFLHMVGLRDEFSKHLNKLKRQVDGMKMVLGEPLAASVSRRIYRDTSCLSCANPAHITPEEDIVPILPPLRPSGADQINDPNKQRNALTACIPGLKITHSIDPRAKICTRYCGGSHTKKRSGMTRNANNLRLQGKPLRVPDIVATVGDDGKIADEVTEQPCIPCNQEYGAGEGSVEQFSNDDRESLHTGTSEKRHCDKEKEVSSIPRCSFSPSVAPMNQLSGMTFDSRI